MSLPPAQPRIIPKLKFTWAASSVLRADWRLGTFGFYERIHGFPRSGFAISLRGVLAWTAALLLMAYLGGAAVLARWFARQPHNEIRYADVLAWPVRREHVLRLRGRAWIAQGKDAVNAKRWAEGVFYLRRGLDAYPDDFSARLALAEFFILSGERPRAMALLADGPNHGLPPREWRDAVFSLAAAGEDWATELLICDRCLERARRTTQFSQSENVDLLVQKAAALIALGRPAEALAVATGDQPELVIQHARALAALHRADEAIRELEQAVARAATPYRAALLQQLAEMQRDAGRYAAMSATLAEIRERWPVNAPLAAFVVTAISKGQKDEGTKGLRDQGPAGKRGQLGETALLQNRTEASAGEVLDDYIFRFGGTPANLLLVARPLSELPDIALTRRVVAAARERGYDRMRFDVLLAMALLRGGAFRELADLVRDMAAQRGTADPATRLWLDWISRLSDAIGAANPVAADEAADLVVRNRMSLDAFRTTILAFRHAGLSESALRLATAARRLYPESPSLRTQESELMQQRAEAAQRAAAEASRGTSAQPLSSPAPAAGASPIGAENAPPAPPKPTRTYATPQEFFAVVDAALARQDWPAAGDLLNAARLSPPRWLPYREHDFAWRELKVEQGRHDGLALRRVLRLFLNGDEGRTSEVLAWARQLADAGQKDDAGIIARTVLEKFPGHAEAKSLLQKTRK